jgi:hypothetical protein
MLPAAGMLLASSRAGAAPVGYVTTEAVTQYGGTAGDLPYCDTSVDAFRNKLVGHPSSAVEWQTGHTWVNGDVWQADFYDPDRLAGGGDQYAFDDPGLPGISYFCGHGTADNGAWGSPTQFCPTTCNNPYDWEERGTGICRIFPGLYDNRPFCTYDAPRRLIGFSSGARWDVYYSDGPSAYGERTNWAGAGTDGGAKLVVLENSNALLPGFVYTELHSAFAGIHMLAATMPTNGDFTPGTGQRGSLFGQWYVDNPNSSVADAWVYSATQDTDGSPCAGGGGYQGINGCGCTITVSMGSTREKADTNRDDTWPDLMNASRDGDATTWYSWLYTCNYDTGAYPLPFPI